jgi:hypothetical protein
MQSKKALLDLCMHSPHVKGLTNDALKTALPFAIHLPHPKLWFAAVMLFTSGITPLNEQYRVQHKYSTLQQHFAVAA